MYKMQSCVIKILIIQTITELHGAFYAIEARKIESNEIYMLNCFNESGFNGDLNQNGHLNLSACGLTKLDSVCGECKLRLFENSSSTDFQQANSSICDSLSINSLDVSQNDLTSVNNIDVPLMGYLTSLNLSRNSISFIEDSAFVRCSILSTLDLSYNYIDLLTTHIFDGLYNLIELFLEHNSILNVESVYFKDLVSLQRLDLSHNKIQYLHKHSFEGARSLQTLNLRNNFISNQDFHFLPAGIKLSSLDLSGNKFTEISGSLCEFCNVASLFLQHCTTLTNIMSSAFSNCSNMISIDISDNPHLIFLDKGIFPEDYCLQTLDISNTRIQFLPNLSRLTNVIYKGTNLSASCYQRLESDTFNFEYSDDSSGANTNTQCAPQIVSQFDKIYYPYIGDTLHLSCLAFGRPWPTITWQQLGDSDDDVVNIAYGYKLNLEIKSLNVRGRFRCLASNGIDDSIQTFLIHVQPIDVGLKILAKNARAIIVTWNQSYHVNNHIVLYREYETSSTYVNKPLNKYWRVFKITGLASATKYEICIASSSDTSDRTCVRTRTDDPYSPPPGIQHNGLAIGALTTAGIVFAIFVITTVYRCARKIHVIATESIYVVGTGSSDGYDNVDESTYLYENHYTDFLLDAEQKTEL